MRNKPLRAFASPIKSTVSDVTKEVATSAGKQTLKKVVKTGAKKVLGRAAGVLAGGLGVAAGTLGAAYGVVKGYGDLAKTKHGKQIIKDSRVGTTRKI